ncbi:hypothetical protein [Nocardioides dongxiaopingii]|uniref:hypothetical protein n=1 Tax=Nocardioides dongxiaopingii TaxID=2576036 RepID=UPI0010C76D6F|nr:hypothetical protein [Nocardioides dongxiaopingii]
MSAAASATRLPGHLVGSAVVATAAAASWYVARGAGVDGVGLARFLLDHGAVPYAAGLGWVLVAPVVLALALLARRWSAWPWVVAVTVHLAVLLALALRLRHLVPDAVGATLGAHTVLGLASVAVVVAERSRP